MRVFIAICFALSIIACQSTEEKKAAAQKPQLDNQIVELVQFMQDSISGCGKWLSKDYRIRKFFDESDSVIDVFESKFTHDDIIDIYESVETMTTMDFAPYLDSLNIPYVTHIDSVQNCASAINTVAFLRNGQRALVIYVKVEDNIVRTNSFILQKERMLWSIKDTLRENVHPRKTY